MMASPKFFCATVLATAGLVTSAANAQSVSAANEAGPHASASPLGDIVVTARRTKENIQSVPISITALSQAALTEHSIKSSFELSSAVSGLSITADTGNNSVPSFSIRGHGLAFEAAAGSVETYFADVPLSAPFEMPTLPPQFFDIASFQVLKGPQGTLFGRNATGGAVVIVPEKPSDQFGGYFRVQGGNFNDTQFEGAINLPIVDDKVLLRVAAFRWHRNGYSNTVGGSQDIFGNTLPSQNFNNQDVTEVRSTLLLRPTEALENSTILTYHVDGDRSTPQAAFYDLGSPVAATLAALYPNLLNLGPYKADVSINLVKPKTNSIALINTTTYNIRDTDLLVKNIFGYIHSQGYATDSGDSDGTPLTLVDVLKPQRAKVNNQFTDEFQLQGKALDRKLSWIVGGLADLTREPGQSSDKINIQNYFYSGLFTENVVQSTYNSYSAFGSGTYAVTPALNVSAGLRSTWDHIATASGVFSQDTPIVSIPSNISLTNMSKSFHGLTYNIGLDYHVSRRVMVYGGYRHGYKRGGLNTDIIGTNGLVFSPEKDDDFYAGVKSTFTVLGRPARLNVEGFYDIYRDTQYSSVVAVPVGNAIVPTTLTQNVPRGIYRGIDVDFDAEMAPWLDLSGSYSYLAAKWTDWPDTSVPGMAGNLAVNPTPWAPRHQFNATARFHWQLVGDSGEIVVAPTVHYQARTITQFFSERLNNASAAIFGPTNSLAVGANLIPAYTTLNLRFEWNKFLGSKIDLAANVTNVTNKATLRGDVGLLYLGVDAVSYGPPRMFSIEASIKF